MISLIFLLLAVISLTSVIWLTFIISWAGFFIKNFNNERKRLFLTENDTYSLRDENYSVSGSIGSTYN